MKLSERARFSVIRSVVGSWVIEVILLQMVVFRQPEAIWTAMSSPGPKLPNGALGWFFTTTEVTESMFFIEVSTLLALADIRALVYAVWSVYR